MKSYRALNSSGEGSPTVVRTRSVGKKPAESIREALSKRTEVPNRYDSHSCEGAESNIPLVERKRLRVRSKRARREEDHPCCCLLSLFVSAQRSLSALVRLWWSKA